MTIETPTKPQFSKLYYAWMFVVPLVILVLGAALPLLWRNELPSQIPHHWGSDGPDSFGSLGDLLIPLIGIGAVLIIGMGVLFRFIAKDISVQRIGVVTNVFLAALMSTITITTTYAARGLTDTSNMDIPGIAIVGGIIGGIGIGVALAATLPAPTPRSATSLPGSTAPRTPLAESEDAAWVTRQTAGKGVWIMLIASVAITGVAVWSATWAMLILPAVLILLLVAMFIWDVWVDASGLTVVSALKVMRRHIPLDQIEEAKVTTIHPFAQYGGWGWRAGRDGSVAVVLRGGEALEVVTSGGGRFLVTVDGAQEAAGLINTLIERSRRV